MEKIWNGLKIKQQQALLIKAGYGTGWAGRCWQFMPRNLKEDLQYTYNRLSSCMSCPS